MKKKEKERKIDQHLGCYITDKIGRTGEQYLEDIYSCRLIAFKI